YAPQNTLLKLKNQLTKPKTTRLCLPGKLFLLMLKYRRSIMAMPRDLLLVRHGESEGNMAARHSRQGDNSLYTDSFRSRHGSTWRLTNKGIEQDKNAGKWVKENFQPPYFDGYLA